MTKTRICRIAAWTCNNWHDPCNTIYAENHAYDHNKIVNIELNSKYFNVAESACLQCMSSASDWSNSTCQPFLTSNWHFWQMVQMSAQCLLCKTEKAQISGQMQIICTGWHLCFGGQELNIFCNILPGIKRFLEQEGGYFGSCSSVFFHNYSLEN